MIAMLPNLANAADAKSGKTLFLNKCASCHNNSMVADMTGPALYGAEDRWKKYPGDIYKWIRNSVALAATGHPKATVMVKWADSEMTAFENLTDTEIEDILAYIQVKGEFGCVEPPCQEPTSVAAGGAGAKSEPMNPMYGYALLSVLLIAVALLGRYINTLTRLSQGKMGAVVSPEKSFFGVIFNPSVVKLLILSLTFANNLYMKKFFTIFIEPFRWFCLPLVLMDQEMFDLCQNCWPFP